MDSRKALQVDLLTVMCKTPGHQLARDQENAREKLMNSINKVQEHHNKFLSARRMEKKAKRIALLNEEDEPFKAVKGQCKSLAGSKSSRKNLKRL